MNIDKLERANILAKSLIPKVDELLNMSSKSNNGRLADAIWGLSECDEVYSKDKKEYDGVTLISDSIKINLKEEYAKFFNTELSSTEHTIKSYKGYVVNTGMYNWAKQNQVYDTISKMER